MGRGDLVTTRRDLPKCRRLQSAGAKEDCGSWLYDHSQRRRSGERFERRFRGARVQAAESGVFPAVERRDGLKAVPYRIETIQDYLAFLECRPKAAPCGSIALSTRSPSGTSIGPLRIFPPAVFTREAAASTSGTRK